MYKSNAAGRKLTINNHGLFMLILLGLAWNIVVAQEESPPLRPVRNTFESIWLIDNQTMMVPFKGTFEWDIQHRFGTANNGYKDYYGLAAPSNIRLGFSYVIIDNLQLGLGITKERKIWDFSAKYSIVKQKQGGGFPFSISYFVNTGLDSRAIEDFVELSDRISYFNQFMVARKISDVLSIQVSPSLSYFNFQEPAYDDQGEIIGHMKNKHFALSFLSRYKMTEVTSFLLDIDLPLTNHDFNNPKSNISFGFEFTTSAHAFQLFISNYKSLSPQYNQILNQNEFKTGEVLVGFNLTRLWSF